MRYTCRYTAPMLILPVLCSPCSITPPSVFRGVCADWLSLLKPQTAFPRLVGGVILL
jgi:hypothetical protein